jgi:hypothetical protein
LEILAYLLIVNRKDSNRFSIMQLFFELFLSKTQVNNLYVFNPIDVADKINYPVQTDKNSGISFVRVCLFLTLHF